MFSSEFKKVIATILLLSMVVTSNGFFTLANSVQSVVSVAAENTDEEPKNYHEMYYHEEYYEESIIMDPSDDVSGGNDAFIESTENLDDGNDSDDESKVLYGEESEDETQGNEKESEEDNIDDKTTIEEESEEGSHSSHVQDGEEESHSTIVEVEPEEDENDEKIGIAEYDELFDVETKANDENDGGSQSSPVQEESESFDRRRELHERDEATASEVEESEEGSHSSPVQDENEVATASEVEESEEGSHSSPVQDENEIATASEAEEEVILDVLPLEKIASRSSVELLEDKLLGAPGDPDWSGEHVHKECGVASGSDCVHTEYAAHGIDAGLDYKNLHFDDHFGEFIDDLAGWTMVGMTRWQ